MFHKIKIVQKQTTMTNGLASIPNTEAVYLDDIKLNCVRKLNIDLDADRIIPLVTLELINGLLDYEVEGELHIKLNDKVYKLVPVEDKVESEESVTKQGE